MEQTLISKDYLLELAQKAQVLNWPAKFKAEALEAFSNQKIPTTKDEFWRHTNITPLLETEFQVAYKKEISKEQYQSLEKIDFEAHTLVFYKGYFQAHLSKIEKHADFEFGPVSEYLSNQALIENLGKTKVFNQNIFSALSSAYAQDGAFLHIKKNKFVEKPFHVVLIDGENNEATLSQLHHLFVIETNAQASLFVSSLSLSGKSFENTSTEVILGENTNFEQYIVQEKTNENFLVNTIQIFQQASSNYQQNTFSMKGQLIRNNTTINFDNENSYAKLNGLYIPEGNEHHDHSIWVNHNQPHCTSDENYRGIISDRASAVFFGKVLVARDAQKTNANQSNRNLLLSDYGKVNSKPQLEIYADDVICSHGSTTGQLDEEALFFMRSRGISKDSAIRLLLFAFAADVLEDIKNEEFKVYIDKRLHERFDPAK